MPALALPRHTALGSICHYLAHAEAESFVPVRFTFDLLPAESARMNRSERRARQCEAAVSAVRTLTREMQPALAS
jgi:methylenetetrahydrofolate--tRNA-(uracil-5-)-methyltransferase